ncbi:hypothetical protein TRVL_02453 [Trypanosoma vivax]|nr:hypothetical protein TRVL_02453 [Trypanosoma vivax]
MHSTRLVPVRVVSVHGDFFDTEVHHDAPLRIVQRAVEDYFKVRPELQLLTHNRQPINPTLSLRRNGCLLLKGDPYVKLLLDVKKGTRLNIICQMAQCEPVPLACAATDTIWDVKTKFCAALARSDVTPQRIRLLWRYWELNDKATVDYYHLPTNAKLSVMRKRSFLTAPSAQRAGGKQASTAVSRRSHRHSVQRSRAACDDTRSVDVAPAPSDQLLHQIGDKEFWGVDVGKAIDRTIDGGGVTAWPVPVEQYGRSVVPLHGPPFPGEATGQSSGTPPSANDVITSVNPVSCGASTRVVTAAELEHLRQQVAILSQRIERENGSAPVNYKALLEVHHATVARVAELEETLERFQSLLRRALVLL